MTAQTPRGNTWPDGLIRLSQSWRRGYKRIRCLGERGPRWSVPLAVPALGHRAVTAVLSRLVFLAMHPLLCVRHPLVLARFSGRRVKALLLNATGLQALSESLDASREAGMEPFLIFGTLLGHHREGGFLVHDRDIDLGYTAENGCGIGAVAEAMARRGWAVKRQSPGLISFVKPFFRSATVDFYLFYRDADGMMCVHREATANPAYVYVYPPDVLGRCREETFGGRLQVRVPEQPERFLEITYGDWRTPRSGWDYRLDPHNRRPCVGEPSLRDPGPARSARPPTA